MAKRKAISKKLRIDVLTEAGYRCAVPTCRGIIAIDMHHIVPVAEDGPNELANLLALCPTCHALFTRGTISQESIHVWKGNLVALNAAYDRGAIDEFSSPVAPATGELQVIVDEHHVHSRAEFGLTLVVGVPNPSVVGVELTVYPSLPMRIVWFQMEVDSNQIQAMGRIVKDASGSRFQPVEPETVNMASGFNIGFEVPHTVAQGRQRVRILVRAAGKTWPSEFFEVEFPTYATSSSA